MNDHTPDTPVTEADAPLPPPRRRPSWWKQLLLALVILACGAVIGAGAAMKILPRRMTRGVSDPGRWSESMSARMMADLDLTPEQTEQVKQIVRQRMQAIETIRAEAGPKYRAEFEGMRDDIIGVLTKEQAEKWKQQFERYRRMGPPHGRWRGGRPDGRPDGQPGRAPESARPDHRGSGPPWQGKRPEGEGQRRWSGPGRPDGKHGPPEGTDKPETRHPAPREGDQPDAAPSRRPPEDEGRGQESRL